MKRTRSRARAGPAKPPATRAAENSSASLPPCAAFLRAALEEALACASGSRVMSDDEVHRFRKALKRARAALRLLRAPLGEARYRQDNLLLRQAGRRVAAARDATTLLLAFERLAARSRQDRVRRRVLRLLRAKRLEARKQLRRSPAARAKTMLELQRLRADAVWQAAAGEQGSLAPGLRRVYRNGRRALDFARETLTAEAFHEWRKQAKYLQNALLALQSGERGEASGMIEQASQLSDLLGLEHDLAVLSRELERPAYASIGEAAREALHRRIARRRAQLQAHALSLGDKLYARKPKRVLAGLSNDGATQ